MTIYMKTPICLLMVMLIVPFSRPLAQTDSRRELGVGVISSKPDKRFKDFAPLSRYLAKHLKSRGIREVKISVAKDIEEMRRLVRQGDVDVVLESAMPTIELEKEGMTPSLLAWRKGAREYRTLFVVRKDSPVKTLADLKGKTIAFQDANSTSAFAIPVVELKKNSLRVGPGKDGRKREDGVSYYFAGEATNEAYWVAQKKADAAAFSNNDWEGLPEKVRAELRTIYETNPILRYVVSIRKELTPSIKEAIESILIQMDKDPEGKRALRKASDIKKIEPLDDRDLRSLEYVRSLIKAGLTDEAQHQ